MAFSVFFFSSFFSAQATNRIGNAWGGNFVFNGGGAARPQQFEVASVLPWAGSVETTNFFIGTFQVGNPISGSNAFVTLTDARANGFSGTNQILAASNIVIATAGSTLNLNNRAAFTYNLSNSGTIQATNGGNPAGMVVRLDVVNSFTNNGTIQIGNGTTLRLSNAFVNADGGTVQLFNGGVLTNRGDIVGEGLVSSLVGNEGRITATGGVLRMTAGFTNTSGGPVNAGLLRAIGMGAELRIDQAFTNVGIIAVTNGIITAPRVVNNGLIRGMGLLNTPLSNAGNVTNDTGGALILGQAVTNLSGGNIIASGGSNSNEVLYVDVLHLFSNATIKLSQLTIYVGLMLVDDASGQTMASGVINEGNVGDYGLFDVFLDSGGQIVFIPEPSTGVLFGVSFAVLAGWRRRRKRTEDADGKAAHRFRSSTDAGMRPSG